MKAIIIAAGQGSRLSPLTDNRPKCLLEVKGKTIMQRQLDVLRQCDINEIVVVRGHKGERLDYQGIRYYENTDYKNNNILRSLFYAENEMNDEFIFSYSDIIFEQAILEKLLQSQADISIVVDIDWVGHYEHRYQHPIEEAELVTIENNRILRIGKRIVKPTEAYGEFIGLAKFTKSGAKATRVAYHRVAKERQAAPFHRAVSLKKAYMTDMLQELIDSGFQVKSVDIKGGWMEIDTPQDLAKVPKWLANNT